MKSKRFGVLTVTILGLILSCGNSIPFDQELWESDGAIDSVNNKLSLRQKMVESVLEQIEGLTRQEVILMLGKKTETDYFSVYDEDLIYVLGPERSYFSIDYEWLHLSFDNQDRLIESELITD